MQGKVWAPCRVPLRRKNKRISGIHCGNLELAG